MIQLFNLLINELKKEKSLLLKYKIDWLLEIFVLIAFFYFLCLIRLSNHTTSLLPFLKGYTLWFYSSLIIWNVSNKVSEERASGIYEQYYLSIYPVYLIHLVKILTNVLKSLFLMIILYIAILYFFQIHFTFKTFFHQITTMLFILPMLLGLSFFMGGATLFFRKIGPIKSMLNYLFLFCSGVFFPLEKLPFYFKTIAKILPISIGFKILEENHSFFDLLRYQGYFLLIFILGLLFYKITEKKTLKKGNLSY